MSVEDRITEIMMSMEIKSAQLDLLDSNELTMSACTKLIIAGDVSGSIEELFEAKEKLEIAQIKLEEFMLLPNLGTQTIDGICRDYEAIISILYKGADERKFIASDFDKVMEVLVSSSKEFVVLTKYMLAFINLNEIRKFDRMPDKEALEKLNSGWYDDFRLENIKMPTRVKDMKNFKNSLYLVWIDQFSESSFNKSEVFKELDKLRKNDNMTDKRTNQKWSEFLEKFIINISTKTEAIHIASVFLQKY